VSITLEEFERRLEEASTGGELKLLVRKTLAGAAKQAERGAKLRTTGGNPLFVRTGRLRSSIRSGVRGGVKGGNKGAIEGWLRAGGTQVKGQVKYAAVHELGLTIPNPWGGFTNMPKRPFLKPSIEEAADLLPDALGPLLGHALKADI